MSDPVGGVLEIRDGVAVFLLRPHGESHDLLLLRRDAEPFRGEWFTVEGGIEPAEQPWAAALREVHEETALVPERFYSADQQPKIVPSLGYAVRMYVFVGFVPSDAEAKLNHEHTAYEWAPLAEAASRLPLPAQRAALEHVLARFILAAPPEGLRVR